MLGVALSLVIGLGRRKSAELAALRPMDNILGHNRVCEWSTNKWRTIKKKGCVPSSFVDFGFSGFLGFFRLGSVAPPLSTTHVILAVWSFSGRF